MRQPRRAERLVLTDIRMPGLDGHALYQEIKRRWPERVGCIVFVTGDTLASTSREFAARSGRPVIEKPFLPSEVRRVVAEMIAAKGQAGESAGTQIRPGI